MLRWIYPVTCSVCGEAAPQSLCESCMDALPRVPRPLCLYCGAATYGTASEPDCCDACKGGGREFSWARSALVLEGETRRLVHDLKYHHASYLAAPLARILHRLWEDTPQLNRGGEWGLVPVPVDAHRRHERGYNQAELLARELALLCGSRVVQPLTRMQSEEEKRSMTRMSARARRQQANKVYALSNTWEEKNASLPSRLVIVDDVYTTGATSRACARILKTLPGVQEVGVLTLARAM